MIFTDRQVAAILNALLGTHGSEEEANIPNSPAAFHLLRGLLGDDIADLAWWHPDAPAVPGRTREQLDRFVGFLTALQAQVCSI